ncbi:MAG: ABC transporter ATP-binding protein [Methyloligellaceae bacterium]
MAFKTAKSGVGVTIEDVRLSFGPTEVLKGVNFEIQPGEMFTFLGPSGSGKSTLLRAIAGFGPRPGGRILIGDVDVTHLPPWQRNVGMVFQSYALWPHMTVRKNVAFGLEERKVSTKDIPGRVDAALELVGLLDFAERRPSQLSGGQQQRVALARTIVVEPQVLLLDEPLSNLDANLRVQMRREILELQRKLALTTIFVTHDQEEANTISDRIAVLNDGTTQQVGAPMELYDEPTNRFVAHFLGTANLIDGTVQSRDGKAVFTAPDGTGFSLDGAHTEIGDQRTAMFRPQSLRIVPDNATVHEGLVKFSGNIEHREFLGNLVRYSVRVGENALLVDDTHQAGRHTYDVGQSVMLGLDIAQVRILSA